MSKSAQDAANVAKNAPAWTAELASAMELLEQGKAVNCLAALHAMLQVHAKDELCRALIFDGMGRALFMDEKPDLGLEAFNESLAILRRLYAEQKISASLLLGSTQNLAHALMMAGNMDESLKAARAALALAEKAWPNDSPEIAHTLFTLASTLYEMKDYDAAEAYLLRAKKILKALPGTPDEQIGTILNNLGRIYEERGDLANGIDYHRRAVEFRRQMPNREDLAFSLGNYGVALGTAGKLREACEALGESVVIYSALDLADTPVAQAFAVNLDLFQNVKNQNARKRMTNETCSIKLPPLALDREAIAKRLRVPENSRKREELWEMIDTIEAKAAPAVYLRELGPQIEDAAVTLDGELIASGKLAKILAEKAQSPDGKPVVFAFAATYGQEACDWGNAREFGLPVFWAQTILEEGMLMLLDLLEAELRKKGDYAVSVVEPGVPDDWPLEKQDIVFRLLGGESRDFGITPNHQSLMLPFRYVAGLAYLSNKITPQCGICHFTDCNKQRGGCWRLQAIKRKAGKTGREVDESQA